MKTFNRIRKQVDDRVKHRRPRASVHVIVHDLLVYVLEVKTFHVKQAAAREASGMELSEYEKDLLAAGEHLEEATKTWLAGDDNRG